MASFPSQWSVDTNLTGNSQFVIDSTGKIWLVSNTTGGVAIFSSADNGITFTQVIAVPGLVDTTIAFDPAICIDSNNVLHFLGQVNAVGGIELQKFSFDTNSSTLQGPFTLFTGAAIGSDYDILSLENGHTFTVCSLLTVLTETMYGIEMDISGNIVAQDTIYTTPLTSGNRMGSVSLITPDGSNVEIYLGQHTKLVNFTDFTVLLTLITRSNAIPSIYSTGTTLYQFQARHVDDRLTVIARGNERFLSQCYYTQTGLYLAGNIILGYLPVGSSPVWSFTQMTGTPLLSLVEPTFSISATGSTLTYITKNYTQVPVADGTMTLVDVNPSTWAFTPRIDFHTSNKASFIRGTKSNFDSTKIWGFIGQPLSESASYYTGFNAPPVVILQPSAFSANRGVTYQLDASNTYDPNGDAIAFEWNLQDGTGLGVLSSPESALPNIPDEVGTQEDTATFLVPYSIGPDAYSMTIELSVADYDVNGNQLHSAVSASCAVTIPAVSAPTIGTLTTATVARGVLVTLTPSITNANGTTLTYSWSQVSGTQMLIVGSTSGPSLTFNSAGANLAGETVTFQLTVSDNINDPVSQTFDVPIAASSALGTSNLFLAQSVWPGNIAQRNNAMQWPVPHVSRIFTTFTATRRFFLIRGVNITAFIGPNEVLIYGWDPTVQSLLLRYLFLPDPSITVVDAVQTETDYTVVLTSDMKLLKFLGVRPVLSTDTPDFSIDLTTITSLPFTNIMTLPSYANQRVLALLGPQGCLLLQVDNTTFAVQQNMTLNQGTGLTYGASNVKWLRSREVESLYTGQLLIGTTDELGNTYETLVDIPTKQVIQIWNASVLKSQFVSTGEMLFQPESTYNGLPNAPVLQQPLLDGLDNILTWTQERPDLVTGYIIQYSFNGGPYTTLANISSGNIFVYVATLPGGQVYNFRIQALSLDGPSAWSNVVS